MNHLGVNTENSLELLFELEKASSKNQTLFSEGKTIYLQIGLFKVPIISGRRRKFLKLCHSIYGDNPEICLFVPNKKTGVEYKKTTDELIDFCVEYYTEILEKHKVKGITTVMPLKQLKSEYGAFELRRKLVNRFDLFLCKNSLLYNPGFLNALGKIFIKANKEPLGISFPDANVDYDSNFKENIKRAIFSTSFYIKPFSDNYSIPIGTLLNTKKQLQENLKAVLDQICKENVIPGGPKNIKVMYLWPSQSKTIPLYMSSDLPTDLPRPRIKPKRKGRKAVKGEISTQPGKKVIVTAGGEVYVTRCDGEPDCDDLKSEDSFEDGPNVEEESKVSDENVHSNMKINANNEESESESEGDEEIEEREQRLLNARKRQTEEESYGTPNKVKKCEQENEDSEDGNEESEEGSRQKSISATKKQKIKTRGNGRVKKIKAKKQEVNFKKKNVEKKGGETNETKLKKNQKGSKAARKITIKQEKFKLQEKAKLRKQQKSKSK